MRVGVTGASGFIGRHVLDELARQGIPTLAAVRRPPTVDRAALAVEWMVCDVAEADSAALDALAGVDVLVHLAWGGLPHYRSRHHFECELPVHYRFLKALVERGLPALVVAGTCAEYGMQSGELAEDLPSRPGHAYAAAKDMLRRQLDLLQREQPFALTWARLFYMFGDGQPSTSLYAQVHAAVAQGAGSFDMSGGEQLRDFLPVTEVARLLVAVALRAGNHGIVNICNGSPISVRRLVEEWLLARHSTLRLNLGRHPYPDYEPMAFWGSRRRLDQVLHA
jgi:nucleoside-diphosphate-sugar epimerase